MGNYRNFTLAAYFVAQGTARAERNILEKDIRFFERYLKLDKVYLEAFRGGVLADPARLEMCGKVFGAHGIQVAGGLTTTMPSREWDAPKQRLFDTLCYNDPAMLARLREVSAYIGGHFDEFIIDDFFFTNCTCEACRAGRDEYNMSRGIPSGVWQAYRCALMERVSRDCVIGPAKLADPKCRITIKYPNWAESYQETGYSPFGQRDIFDQVYVGTEARDTVITDQHLPRYLSFSLMTYFKAMCPGRCGGGWFDPFDLVITEQYLEQAFLTAFSKPGEITLFCFQALLDHPFVPALGWHLDKLDEALDHCGAPVGIPCYLPDNSRGEDNIQDFLGMCGLPVTLTPYFPSDAAAVLLTRASACDPDVVDRLEKYVAAGGRALVTSGFLEETMDRGIQRMTSVRFTGRRVRGRNYRIETAPRRHLQFVTGTDDIGIPVCEFRNNSTWAVVKAADTEESFGLLLKDTYGLGEMWTLAVPDNFPDLYRIPAEALTRVRREFPAAGAYLECGAGVSLFAYDNDTLIVYPYVTARSRPGRARLHVLGEARALSTPMRKDGRDGEMASVAPLYVRDGETVFDIGLMPGKYEVYRIAR